VCNHPKQAIAINGIGEHPAFMIVGGSGLSTTQNTQALQLNARPMPRKRSVKIANSGHNASSSKIAKSEQATAENKENRSPY